MQILCSYSSLVFDCAHFPGFLQSREACHPIFHMEQRKLLPYLRKWATHELTETDSYLLFVALLKSSDLVDFRVPTIRTEKTASIIAQEMEHLARTVIKLNAVQNPSVVFPHYVITPETKTLDNVRYWIENWEESYTLFTKGKLRDIEGRDEWKKLQLREAALQRFIKNPHRDVSTYSGYLSEWAAIAGNFPTFNITSPWNGETISCSTFWKQIITYCAQEEKLFSIARKDLAELLEHCEEHIPSGSIYSHMLFKVLRAAEVRLASFLSLGDLDLSAGTYAILEATDTAESANIKAAIQAAPETEPRPEQYPTKFAYMKAKFRWDMSKRYGNPSTSTSEDSTDNKTDDGEPA